MSPRRDHRTRDLFESSPAPSSPGALAGLKTKISHLMSAAIRDASVDRYAIAARMSALLGEDVPKTMLDAYTAESREDQNVPAYRFLAFILATESFVELDELMHLIGCRVLTGKETQIAAITQLEVRRDQIDKRIRDMRKRMKGDGT